MIILFKWLNKPYLGLMAAMKNMIDKIEGLVKNERKSRKR